MSGLEKLTTKQLKDIIRDYKKESCPPYSKLKKNDLEELVKKLGLSITLIPKQPKQPKKPKQPKQPDPDTLSKKAIELQKIRDKVDKLIEDNKDKLKEMKFGSDDRKGKPWKSYYGFFVNRLNVDVSDSSAQGIDNSIKLGKDLYRMIKNKLKQKPETKPETKPEEEPKPEEIVKEEEFKGLDKLGGLTPEEFNNFNESDHIGWYGMADYELAMYEYILRKNNNDCIPLIVQKEKDKDDEIFLLGIDLDGKGKIIGNVYNKGGYNKLLSEDKVNDAVNVMKDKCKKRFIAIPLQVPHHLNMLIMDLKTDSVERFEPHGSGYDGRKGQEYDKKVNNTIKNLVENDWGMTYNPPSVICPYTSGFQSIESDSKMYNDVLTDEYNKYITKQGGLCALWSYIWLDLRLSNPNFTPQEIFEKILRGGKVDKYKKDRDELLERLGKDLNWDQYEEKKKELKKTKLKEVGDLPDLLKKWSVIYAKKVLTPLANQVRELIIDNAYNLGDMNKKQMGEYLDQINPLKFLHYLSHSKNTKLNIAYKQGKKKIKIPNYILKKYTLYRYIHDDLVADIFKKIIKNSLITKAKIYTPL
jgi:hypothetical protein